MRCGSSTILRYSVEWIMHFRTDLAMKIQLSCNWPPSHLVASAGFYVVWYKFKKIIYNNFII